MDTRTRFVAPWPLVPSTWVEAPETGVEECELLLLLCFYTLTTPLAILFIRGSRKSPLKDRFTGRSKIRLNKVLYIETDVHTKIVIFLAFPEGFTTIQIPLDGSRRRTTRPGLKTGPVFRKKLKHGVHATA